MDAIEGSDDGKFLEDSWVHENGGGEQSRLIHGDHLFEKGGRGIISSLRDDATGADVTTNACTVMRDVGYESGEWIPLLTTGISSVMHPCKYTAPKTTNY